MGRDHTKVAVGYPKPPQFAREKQERPSCYRACRICYPATPCGRWAYCSSLKMLGLGRGHITSHPFPPPPQKTTTGKEEKEPVREGQGLHEFRLLC